MSDFKKTFTLDGTIDEDTAKWCCSVLEMYLIQNENKELNVVRSKDNIRVQIDDYDNVELYHQRRLDYQRGLEDSAMFNIKKLNPDLSDIIVVEIDKDSFPFDDCSTVYYAIRNTFPKNKILMFYGNMSIEPRQEVKEKEQQ